MWCGVGYLMNNHLLLFESIQLILYHLCQLRRKTVTRRWFAASIILCTMPRLMNLQFRTKLDPPSRRAPPRWRRWRRRRSSCRRHGRDVEIRARIRDVGVGGGAGIELGIEGCGEGFGEF